MRALERARDWLRFLSSEDAPTSEDAASAPIPLAALVAVGVATLMLEILLTRVFSVTMWYHFAFVAISLALLGMSAAGVLVAILPKTFRPSAAVSQMGSAALGFALATPLCFWASLKVPLIPFDTTDKPTLGSQVLPYVFFGANLLLLSIPFFLAGLAVTLAFTHAPRKVSRVYLSDMVGAALGCVLAVMLLLVISGPSAIVVTAAFGSVAAVVCYLRAKRRPMSVVAAVVAVGLLGLAGVNEVEPVITIERVKSYDRNKGQGTEREAAWVRWHPTSRVAVHDTKHAGGISGWFHDKRAKVKIPELLEITSDAGSRMQIWPKMSDEEAEELFVKDVSDLVYSMTTRPNVLVIGAGGGKDIVGALALGAASVVGVELNPRIVDAVEDVFGDFSGRPFSDDRVTIHIDEGRNFVASHSDKYDVIKISLTDSWTARAAEAYALSESQLYTKEAISDYLDHLTADGFLTITRWYPEESYRLVATISQVLWERGVDDPGTQMLLARTGMVMTVIVKNGIIKDQDENAFSKAVRNARLVLVHRPIQPVRGSPTERDELHVRLVSENWRDVQPEIKTSVAPTTDDRPFFFDFVSVGQARKGKYGTSRSFLVQHARGLYLLGGLLVVTGITAFLAVIAPLLVSRRETRRRAPVTVLLGTSGYFMFLGLGYLAVQLPLLHLFSMFLGHPTYSLAVVLCTLLASSGVGAAVAGRTGVAERHPKLVAIPIVVAILIAAVALPPVLRALVVLPVAARIAISVVLVAPIGMLLGVPFPLGLRKVHGITRELVPWAWAINGAASVVAPVVAMLIALVWGYSFGLYLAAACYAAAGAVSLSFFDRGHASPVVGTFDEPEAPAVKVAKKAPEPLAVRARRWVSELRPRTWRDLLPPRAGWLRLLVSVSSYLMVAAFAGTAVAKYIQTLTLHWEYATLLVPWAVASDVMVYLGIAAVLAALEARWPLIALATIPVAVLVSIMAILNVIYLAEAGEQLTWEALTALADRKGDVADIVGEQLTESLLIKIGVGLTLGIGLPIVLRLVLRRRAGGWRYREFSASRAKCAAWLAAVSGLVLLVTPRPRDIDVGRLAKNAQLVTLRTIVRQFDAGGFDGYHPPRIVSEKELAALAQRSRPNVLIFVEESVRYDHSALAGDKALASTPSLAELAKRGVVAHNARAVLPHTTKSMFSVLCARLPTMQKKLVELSDDIEVQCLPSMLAEAGYKTAFLQTSWGTFEERLRLVRLFGFEEFKAWEDIQGETLGYLASDDESLVKPFAAWLDEIDAKNTPFMAALLTSATHHPYRVSRAVRKRADAAGLPMGSREERYARIIEGIDVTLGKVIEALEKRKLLDNTIIVVFGDHGEGFGDHGVKQHDNNFYEEGLHVPLVIVGPGVAPMELDGNVSLVDITPTLLGLLGLTIDPAALPDVEGYDMLSPDFPTDRPRWFGCWFEMRCRGFMLGSKKIVYEPQSDEAWYFDLAEDPDEREPRTLTLGLERYLRKLNQVFDRRTARKWQTIRARQESGDWLCPEGSVRCKHPRAKKKQDRRTVDSSKKPASKSESPRARDTGKKGRPAKKPPASTKLGKPGTKLGKPGTKLGKPGEAGSSRRSPTKPPPTKRKP